MCLFSNDKFVSLKISRLPDRTHAIHFYVMLDIHFAYFRRLRNQILLRLGVTEEA